MAKSQYPVNGKFGKDFKVPAGGDYGYRMHPIRHERIHHNGVDLWGAKEPLLLEAWHDGVVTVVATNMASFGNYVVIRSKVGKVWITSLYAHMKAPSKLKKGQKVEAGTVVGIMGDTGPVTGKHLHFEIGKGKTHPFIFGGDGSRYYDPLKFVKATIKAEEAAAEQATATAEASTATPLPEEGAVVPTAPLASLTPEDAATLPKPKPAVKKPAVAKKPAAKKTK
jgi:murein DD-endopeptidase MepM/ murein hydrolase activator NlpD